MKTTLVVSKNIRIIAIEPHRQLQQPYVLSYRIIEDIPGEFAGKPIITCPEPIGILSINLGKRSYQESGQLHPKVGLLGLQTHTRQWISQPETSFIMAILTIPGMMTLFPDIGQDTADNLLDIADLWGDRKANQFSHCLPQDLQPNHVKNALDSWLLNLLNTVPIATRKRHLQLHQSLTSNHRIDTACQQLGITPRTLQRSFQRHLGISPKQVMNLHRLQRSIRANVGAVNPRTAHAETTSQSPMQEFADQAHAIRTWRRYLSQTPGRYRTEHRSALAKAFAASTQSTSLDPTLFYL